MMSTQMSQKSTDVVFGYSRSFEGSIPFEIINLCIAYFNVGEEFDTQMSTLPIEGANHTICRCTDPSKNATCFGYNLISGSHYTFYHWRFLVKTLKDESIKNTRFGIMDDESEEVLHGVDIKYNTNDHEKIFDFYVVFAEGQGVGMAISSERGWVEESIDTDINKEYRLAVAGNDAVSIEILEFHSANWDEENFDKFEDLQNVALALPVDIDDKIELFEIAIKINPRSFTYVGEYIHCLLEEREYNKAYDVVLEWYERRYIPIDCIINIINHINGPGFRRKKNKLFELIEDEIYGILDDVYNGLKEFDEAIKYFELSLAYTQEEDVISFCLPKVAQLYHNAKQYKKAYDLILKHKNGKWLCTGYILQTADALFRKEWYQDAHRLFRIATYKDKYLTDCFMSIKADSYYELGDFETAAIYFAFCLRRATSEDVISLCLERLRSIHHFIETQRPKNRENLKLCTMISRTISKYNKPDCKTKHTQIRMTLKILKYERCLKINLP